MEEVIGSIPIRSTNIPFIHSYLPAAESSLLRVRGCGRVLKLFTSSGSINETTLRLASRFCWSTARV
jgi:hypothetical protein